MRPRSGAVEQWCPVTTRIRTFPGTHGPWFATTQLPSELFGPGWSGPVETGSLVSSKAVAPPAARGRIDLRGYAERRPAVLADPQPIGLFQSLRVSSESCHAVHPGPVPRNAGQSR